MEHISHSSADGNHLSLQEQEVSSNQIKLQFQTETERSFKEREFFFQESQKAAFIGSYKCDFVSDYWDSSEVLDEVFGIDRQFIRSTQGWLSLVHPHDQEMMRYHLYDEVILHKKPFNKEYRIIRHCDGEIRWVHGLGATSFNSNGEIQSMIGTIQDITNRKNTEDKLIRSEARLRDLFENSHIGIFHSLKEGRFIAVNQAFTKMLGYSSPDELIAATNSIGDQIYENPDDRVALMNALDKSNGWVHLPKITWKKKDGGIIFVDMMGRNVTNLANDIDYKECFVYDITAKLAAEAMVEQTRLNYESFFNTIDELLFVLDEHGNIIHYNTTVTDRLGFTDIELIGNSVLMVHPEERRIEAGKIVVDMLQGNADFCPVPLKTKSGKLIPVETRIKSGIWDGKPAIFGVTKDISQIKLSEEKFSKVFYINPSPCGISEFETGRYTEVNNAFYDLFGFGKDEVIGHTAVELGILNDDVKNKIMQETDVLGNTINVETNLRTKFGEVKHVLLSTANIDIQDIKHRYTVVHDITIQKQTEIALRESEIRWRELNATKDKFFSIIGHDLKNPFNAIVGFSEVIKDKLIEKDYEGLDEYVKFIRDAALRATLLLSDLLEWSRVQIGKMIFNPRRVDVAKLVFETVELLNDSARQKLITITPKVPARLYMIADKSMIDSILRNLISNAIKFTNPFGEIVITVELQSDKIKFTIADNGIGMSDTVLNRLFRIDETYSSYGTSMESGTGLGLILCKEFVTKHNGEIWVESEQSIGSKFFFTIPISR